MKSKTATTRGLSDFPPAEETSFDGPLGHLHLSHVHLAPSEEWRKMTEHAWRFVFVAQGAAYWLGRGESKELNEGELVVIAPGSEAVVRASQLNDVILETFLFAPELLCGIFTLHERAQLEAGAGRTAQPVATRLVEPRFLAAAHPAAVKCKGLLRANGSLASRVQALGIVAEVFDQELSQVEPELQSVSSAALRFQEKVMQMTDAELVQRTPEELARICGCSGRHFSRLFRRQFSVSVRERQLEIRLLKARLLLKTTNRKVAEIAEDCGYQNVSLFNSLFKRYFRVTPTALRSARPVKH